MAAPGSNPGVCVASSDRVSKDLFTFARQAQRCVLTLDEACAVARRCGILVDGFGNRDGIIGAVAAAGLAASGEDGRFVVKDALRDLSGRCSVPSLLAAGVDEVRGPGGIILTEGDVFIREFPKPALKGGRAVLHVEEDAGQYRDMRIG
jgi:tRNA(Ile2) C34 agmatinyltransferase TiaS